MGCSLLTGILVQCAGHVARTVSIFHNTNVAAFFVSYVAILSVSLSIRRTSLLTLADWARPLWHLPVLLLSIALCGVLSR